MKKIIFIHLLNDFSGSPKVLSQVINSCKTQGFSLSLFTGKKNEGFLSGLAKNRQYYFYRRFDNKYFTLVSYVFSQIVLFFKLLQYINKDIIIYINTMLPFGAALAGKLIRKPVYYHIHETSLKPQLLKKFLRYIVQKTASQIIFVSKTLKEAESFQNLNQEVVYNALSAEFERKGRSHQFFFRDLGKIFNVLMICSLRAYKGVLEFIEIAQQCESHKFIQFSLVLNANQNEIDDFFKKISLPDNIEIVAVQKDLQKYYQKASLLLNLSRIDQWVETFGLTIIEAMSYGIPVIVPPVGGPSEIVGNGVQGYLISSYELETIAKKIVDLYSNEQLCMELSMNARKRASDFNEATFNQEILKVLYA